MMPAGITARCEACEYVMGVNPSRDHIEPAFICTNPRCWKAGSCLTCEMLNEWFERVDADA